MDKNEFNSIVLDRLFSGENQSAHRPMIHYAGTKINTLALPACVSRPARTSRNKFKKLHLARCAWPSASVYRFAKLSNGRMKIKIGACVATTQTGGSCTPAERVHSVRVQRASTMIYIIIKIAENKIRNCSIFRCRRRQLRGICYCNWARQSRAKWFQSIQGTWKTFKSNLPNSITWAGSTGRALIANTCDATTRRMLLLQVIRLDCIEHSQNVSWPSI